MRNILPFFLFAILFSCNDASNSEGANDDDTAASQSATTDTAASSAPMSKTALPLTPDQEVPTNNSTAKGTADVNYNPQTKMLSFTVNYEGLTGKPTMAHIHGTAPRGSNAGVVHDLTGKLQKEVKGSFSDSVRVEGNIKEDSLLSGFYYFNIHTPKHPAGEIRGQIELR